MKLSIDLHIHTCLSPCASDDMTPNNIVNMAVLKGLDIIAITDHNSGENVSAVMECGREKGLIVVPGMEVETQEEIHLVCLFPDLELLEQLQTIVYGALPNIKNKPEIFGQQLVMNSNDEITGINDKMLITATKLSIDEIFHIVPALGGVAYPAHVDRESYNLITNLGGVPHSYKGRYMELTGRENFEDRIYKNERYFTKYISNLLEGGYSFVKSSDAHNLGDILEAGNHIDLRERSISALIGELGSEKK